MISNFENFLLSFKKKTLELKNHYSNVSIRLIFETEILLNYNYDVRKGKEPLKNLRIIKCLKNGSELIEFEFVIKSKMQLKKCIICSMQKNLLKEETD